MSFHTNSPCSVCGPNSLRPETTVVLLRPSECSACGWAHSTSQNWCGYHRFPVGQLAHPPTSGPSEDWFICPAVLPPSPTAPPLCHLSAPCPAGTLTPGTPHGASFPQAQLHWCEELKVFSLKDKLGEGQRVLRSYACFFFLFLSPSGADRPDFFLFYSTFWQAPFFFF